MPSHKCPKCGKKFSSDVANAKPRALQCGHSFCSQCLFGLLKTKKKKAKKWLNRLSLPTARSRADAAATPSRSISCPTCNHASRYGAEDPEPCVNYALKNCEFSCGECAVLFGTAECRPVMFACGHSVCHSCSERVPQPQVAPLQLNHLFAEPPTEENKKICRFKCASSRSSHTMPNIFVRDLVAAGFCEHGRQRSRCKDCGGSSICTHGRERSKCKDCGGSSICKIGRAHV